MYRVQNWWKYLPTFDKESINTTNFPLIWSLFHAYERTSPLPFFYSTTISSEVKCLDGRFRFGHRRWSMGTFHSTRLTAAQTIWILLRWFNFSSPPIVSHRKPCPSIPNAFLDRWKTLVHRLWLYTESVVHSTVFTTDLQPHVDVLHSITEDLRDDIPPNGCGATGERSSARNKLEFEWNDRDRSTTAGKSADFCSYRTVLSISLSLLEWIVISWTLLSVASAFAQPRWTIFSRSISTTLQHHRFILVGSPFNTNIQLHFVATSHLLWSAVSDSEANFNYPFIENHPCAYRRTLDEHGAIV